MRKLLSTSLAAILLACHAAWAQQVSEQQAVEFATRFITAKSGAALAAHSVSSRTRGGRTLCYIVNFAPRGWVLVTADESNDPLLAYSEQGSFYTDDEQMPDGCRGWLDARAAEIERGFGKGERCSRWEQPAALATSRAHASIEPIITVNWNQGNPYNKYCPSDAGGRAVVGCVAVAMAQAMSVARYPERPVGQFSYDAGSYGTLSIDYDSEPPYNWSDILSGANGKEDVARLLYHCGVSLKMSYSPSGSGTQTAYIAGALTRNFAYPSSVSYYYRDNYATGWEELIYNELSAGRAVCYSGADLTKGYGHCFNLDGYDTGLYHVNWGWGGANNGYFKLDALKDATMGMDYTSQQGVIVGVRAPSEEPVGITLSSYQVEENQPAGTHVADITVESEAKNPIYSYKITGPYSILTHGYGTAPFKIEEGKLYTTQVLGLGEQVIRITATNTKTKKYCTREFTIQVVEAGSGIASPAADALSATLRQGRLLVGSSLPVAYCLYGLDGRLLAQGSATGEIDLSDYRGRQVIVKIAAQGNETTRKFIIK